MRFLVVVVVVLLLGGCADQDPPAASPAVPLFSTAPANTAERQVPESCDDVATLDDLTRILATLVTGDVRRVAGVPQDNIGRTARLDCYYGEQPGQSVPKVWIGLAHYVNEESARKRLNATVADERKAGGSTSEVPVGPGRGVLVKHTNWLLVANRGGTTVVVQVRAGIVRDDHAGALLGQLADFALTER